MPHLDKIFLPSQKSYAPRSGQGAAPGGLETLSVASKTALQGCILVAKPDGDYALYVPTTKIKAVEEALGRNFHQSFSATHEHIYVSETSEMQTMGKIDLIAAMGQPIEQGIRTHGITFAANEKLPEGIEVDAVLDRVLSRRALQK